MMTQSSHGEEYINRKGKFTLNVQQLVDLCMIRKYGKIHRIDIVLLGDDRYRIDICLRNPSLGAEVNYKILFLLLKKIRRK